MANVDQIIDSIIGTPATEPVDPAAPEAKPAETSAPPEAPAKPAEAAGAAPAETKPGAAEKPGGEPEPKRGTVPVGALGEERARRREADQKVAALTEKVADMEALFAKFQKGPEKPPPSFEEDAVAATQHHIGKVGERLTKVEKIIESNTEASRTQAEQRAFVGRYVGAVQAFTAEKPDFQEAYRHLFNDRQAEHREAGHTDPELLERMLFAEEAGIVDQAFRDGVNPAQRLYRLAERRGYKPAGAKAPAAAPEPEPDKIETLKKGAEGAKSLSTVRGAPESTVTLERLLELSRTDPAAFDREFEKTFPRGEA